jgi:hypothetical protein
MIIGIYWLQLYVKMAQNAEAVVELLDDMHSGKNILISYYNSKVIE